MDHQKNLSRPRLFALIDGNNFFVSCERVFRPDLRQKPVIVLSNNDGCVISRSAEAKGLGIPMGVPLFRIAADVRRHRIVTFSSNFELYGDLSRRMMASIASLVPSIEVYSVDEAFIDMTGMAEVSMLGQSIRRRVEQWVGIPTCIGIAASKTLAKLANHLAKRYPAWSGVCNWPELPDMERQQWMARTAATEIWGVGRQLGEQLARQGIHTVLDLQRADPAMLRKRYGVTVERIVRELNGWSCLDLDAVAPARQQILRSRSFGRRVRSKDDLRASIAFHVGHAAAVLRAQGGEAGIVGVQIRTSHYNEERTRYNAWDNLSLPVASADTLILTRAAHVLLDRMYRPGFDYYKAGIVLSGLTHRRQQDLFLDSDTPRRTALMQTLDTVNRRFGRQALCSAAELLGEHWNSRLQHRSPRYTTCWQDLLHVGN